MGTQVSPSTGMRYGIKRVCIAWNVARSSFYARQEAGVDSRPCRRRGPAPVLSDGELLEHIRSDLAESPFQGEGYRKVWARLRIGRGIAVSSRRVNRVMREHNLLSPHRVPKGVPDEHNGRICTDAPDLMWGTDGTKILTVDDGWCWFFGAIEHWNAECIGWHVCKRGDRFAALEPVSQGIANIFGSLHADAARGLSLRMDHGTQYLSEHFIKQIRYWGVTPSYAFVEEPQTNGVAERFMRTLKEQVIHGRIYRNLEDLRSAISAFIDRYNREWLVEKLGYKSPTAARISYYQQAAGKLVA